MALKFTSDVVRELRDSGVTEDMLRGALRRGKLNPQRAANGMFLWNDEEVEHARKLFCKQAPEQADEESVSVTTTEEAK